MNQTVLALLLLIYVTTTNAAYYTLNDQNNHIAVLHQQLMDALATENISTVDQLLDQISCITPQKFFWDPLVIPNLFDLIVNKLIEHRADLNKQRGPDQTTLLHWALLLAKDIAVVEKLLIHGANPNIRTSDQETALHLALIEDISSDRSEQEQSNQLVKLLLFHDASIDAQDCHNQTALHHAAINGHWYAFNTLLLEQARIDIFDEDGKTAVDYNKLYKEVSHQHNITDMVLSSIQTACGSWVAYCCTALWIISQLYYQ